MTGPESRVNRKLSCDKMGGRPAVGWHSDGRWQAAKWLCSQLIPMHLKSYRSFNRCGRKGLVLQVRGRCVAG